MPTGPGSSRQLDRVAKQVESDVPRHLHQTLRIGRRRALVRLHGPRGLGRRGDRGAGVGRPGDSALDR